MCDQRCWRWRCPPHQQPPQRIFGEDACDGKEEDRKLKTLKATVHCDGHPPCGKAESSEERFMVNNLKRSSQRGVTPCHDILDDRGSVIMVHSVPVAPLACLLQGLKNEGPQKLVKKQAKRLTTFKDTTCLFLHWTKAVESDAGDCKSHPFVKSRPGVDMAIESLGKFFARRVLLNPDLTGNLQPGMLCNDKGTDILSGCQNAHWDFPGWRKVKAKDVPWVLHLPLTKEGMMLHVWPTERDEATHCQVEEKFKLGKPRLVHVGFGDALLLQADVCHGGCFGSPGNLRFHMILCKKECKLKTDELHFLEMSGVDGKKHDKKYAQPHQIPGVERTFDSDFREELKKKSKTVTACKKAMAATFPHCEEEF